MVYLVDSLEMIGGVVFYKPEEIEPEEAKKLMHIYGWQSYIQNKRNAEIASITLGINVEPNEATLTIDEGNIEDTFIIWVFVSREGDMIIPSFLITEPVLLPI